MKKYSLILIVALISVCGCSSKSKKDADIKAQEITTTVEKSEAINQKETLGVNKDEEVIIQKKTKLTDYLKDVSYQVRKKQDELYGSRRFGTRGIYGRYEECMAKKKQKPKVARAMVLKDEELGQIEADKFGYDEKGQMVALEEQKLRDKIRDMEDKKNRLFAQEEELLSEINTCEAE
jgi:hypothetical protein